MLNQLLQRVEAAARGDVEAAAIQRPDLVMLHAASLQAVPVPHRQGVATCSGKGELRAAAWGSAPPAPGHACGVPAPPGRATSSAPSPPCHRHPLSSSMRPAEPQTPKAASEGPGIPGPCRAQARGSAAALVGVLAAGAQTPAPARQQSRASWGVPSPSPRQIWAREALPGSSSPCGVPRYLWWSRCPVS